MAASTDSMCRTRPSFFTYSRTSVKASLRVIFTFIGFTETALGFALAITLDTCRGIQAMLCRKFIEQAFHFIEKVIKSVHVLFDISCCQSQLATSGAPGIYRIFM